MKEHGHLFQDRFLSKRIEDREYLKNVCRYIHQNPVKAGICNVEEYSWSSYKEYISKSKIINPKMLMSIFSDDRSKMKEEFIKYGYTSMPTNNKWDFESRKVLYAFQCHFRPKKIDGNIDNETFAIIRALNEKIKKMNEAEYMEKLQNFLQKSFFTNIFIENNIVNDKFDYIKNNRFLKN